MKYDELYPDAVISYWYENTPMVRVPTQYPCVSCKENCFWIDGSWPLDVYICSEECRKAFDHQVDLDLRSHPFAICEVDSDTCKDD